MLSRYPEHPLSYRQDTAGSLFALLRQGESCVLIGAAIVSKSNFLHFLLRSNVRQHYLATEDKRTILAYVDMNRCVESSEWAYCELILNTLVMEYQRTASDREMTHTLYDLHKDVVLSRDRLLAQRYLERAVWMLCVQQSRRVVLIIDEADDFYRDADAQFLCSLRALRDDHKYNLSFVLATRQPLGRLRQEKETESFDELFSRNYIGLRPYDSEDANRMLSQLMVRKEFSLEEEECKIIATFSGGHPGLLSALFDRFIRDPEHDSPVEVASFLADAGITAECNKLWESLDEDEHEALFQVQNRIIPHESILDLLYLKGLVLAGKDSVPQIFSPIFQEYVSSCATENLSNFVIDEDTSSVNVAGRTIRGLTPLEFNLIKLLYSKRGKIQTRDEILKALYPDETLAEGVQDNRVDNLIRRIRKRIEVTPDQPRFIITIRGHGYMLAGEPAG